MDVGQIITTTETTNRDRDAYRNENEDFSTYIDDTNQRHESLVGERVAENNSPVDEPVTTDASPEENAPSQSETGDIDSNEQVANAPQSNPDSPIAVAPMATAAANSSGVEADRAAKTSIVNAASGPASLDKSAAAAVGRASEEIGANASLKNSEISASQASIQQSKRAVSADKSALNGTPNVKAETLSSEMLTTLRAEANAKMSEKDVLSAKIAEMLQDGKGKISLTASKQQPNFQATLASSTNLVTASMANNTAAANPAVMAGSAGNLETPAPQAPLPASGNGQGLSTDTMNQPTPAIPTGSVQGVEATATNNMSQASNIARLAPHLPVAEQVSTQISTAIKEGQDRIKISLHPSELGRVEVKLDIGHDGRVLAVVSVDKQETLDLLQRDARSLERALQDAGFDTDSNSLNFGLSQNGQDGQDNDLNFANLNVATEDMGEDIPLSVLSPEATGKSTALDSSLDIQV